MHSLLLLTTLILPLSVLAAPTPIGPIVPVESRYKITQASVRIQKDRTGSFINKDFDFSIRGTKATAIDIHCIGGVDVKDKPESVKLNCPLDPGLEVWVTAGLDAMFDMTVQYLDEERAFGRANYEDANWDKLDHYSPFFFITITAKQGWEISSKHG